jgi:ADP-L-glycero-D-manno-heptose 6-epimerase
VSSSSRIVITGGAGFIGSNILQRLNELGEDRILVVDNLKNADKYRNLVGRSFIDFIPKQDFLALLSGNCLGEVSAVFHQGACTDTLEYDGEYMLRNNFDYSKALLNFCLDRGVRFIYASSAAVYGHVPADGGPTPEAPLNIYGYSKLLFDGYVRQVIPAAPEATIVGLRYFNVYGPGEAHKGRMASMVYQLFQQVRTTGVAKLFGACGAYGPGEQTRDFVYVKNLVDLNLFFWQRPPVQAIVNAGSGKARTWNDLARAVIAAVGRGTIEYVDFPEALKSKYQFRTEADIADLRRLGFEQSFYSLEEGVKDYYREMGELDSRFVPAAK